MIAINKAEATAIRERCPQAHIVRTMKQKSKRHHYFCEETGATMAVIREMRGLPAPKPRYNKNKRRGGGQGGFRPQGKRNST